MQPDHWTYRPFRFRFDDADFRVTTRSHDNARVGLTLARTDNKWSSAAARCTSHVSDLDDVNLVGPRHEGEIDHIDGDRERIVRRCAVALRVT
jgi:hypothetical protein